MSERIARRIGNPGTGVDGYISAWGNEERVIRQMDRLSLKVSLRRKRQLTSYNGFITRHLWQNLSNASRTQRDGTGTGRIKMRHAHNKRHNRVVISQEVNATVECYGGATINDPQLIQILCDHGYDS